MPTVRPCTRRNEGIFGVLTQCYRSEVSAARHSGRRVEGSMFDKKDPRRWNKLAKVQFASPTRFNHPAGVKKSTILPGMNISLRITLIDFKPGQNNQSLHPSPPIEHSSDLDDRPTRRSPDQ